MAGLLMIVAPPLGCHLAHPQPDNLVDIIKKEQRGHVKQSTGTQQSKCVTDEDLAEFLRLGIPAQAAEEVKRSTEFLATVKAIKALPTDQRERLFSLARNVAQPTWEQQGRVTTDGSGQTRAGQEEQLAIANAIVDTAIEFTKTQPQNQ